MKTRSWRRHWKRVPRTLEPEEAGVTMRADNTIALERDDAEKMVRLLERLEDLDDVQEVYSNADISEEIIEQLA